MLCVPSASPKLSHRQCLSQIWIEGAVDPRESVSPVFAHPAIRALLNQFIRPFGEQTWISQEGTPEKDYVGNPITYYSIG
jgi:hypothetical protein